MMAKTRRIYSEGVRSVDSEELGVDYLLSFPQAAKLKRDISLKMVKDILRQAYGQDNSIVGVLIAQSKYRDEDVPLKETVHGEAVVERRESTIRVRLKKLNLGDLTFVFKDDESRRQGEAALQDKFGNLKNFRLLPSISETDIHYVQSEVTKKSHIHLDYLTVGEA